MSISHESWVEALNGSHDSDPDAMTARELGALLGLGKDATLRRIAALIKAGKATPATKRTTDRLGRLQFVSAYRLVNPPAAEVPDDRRAPDRMERRPRRH